MYPFSVALHTMHEQMRRDVKKTPDPKYATDERLKQSWETVVDAYNFQKEIIRSTEEREKRLTEQIAEVQKAIRHEGWYDDEEMQKLYDRLNYLSDLLMTDEAWRGMENRLAKRAEDVQAVQDEYDRRPWLPQTDLSPFEEDAENS